MYYIFIYFWVIGICIIFTMLIDISKPKQKVLV